MKYLSSGSTSAAGAASCLCVSVCLVSGVVVPTSAPLVSVRVSSIAVGFVPSPSAAPATSCPVETTPLGSRKSSPPVGSRRPDSSAIGMPSPLGSVIVCPAFCASSSRCTNASSSAIRSSIDFLGPPRNPFERASSSAVIGRPPRSSRSFIVWTCSSTSLPTRCSALATVTWPPA